MKLTALILCAVTLAVAQQPTVYLIRHGEKPADGDTGLSTLGMERAQCLRSVFGASSQYNIGYILAQAYKKSGKRDRPYLTVKPLADDLGLTVDTSCDRDDQECVQDAVNSYNGPGNILLCWEHKQLNVIAEQLGASNVAQYPDDHFDLIWTDPYPYSAIESTTSESCGGLDN